MCRYYCYDIKIDIIRITTSYTFIPNLFTSRFKCQYYLLQIQSNITSVDSYNCGISTNFLYGGSISNKKGWCFFFSLMIWQWNNRAEFRNTQAPHTHTQAHQRIKDLVAHLDLICRACCGGPNVLVLSCCPYTYIFVYYKRSRVQRFVRRHS